VTPSNGARLPRRRACHAAVRAPESSAYRHGHRACDDPAQRCPDIRRVAGLSPAALLTYAADVEQRCVHAFTLLFGALASPLLMPPDLAAEDASADASAPVPSLPAAVGVASADAGAAPPRSDAAPWHPSDPPFARKAF
jgi:hypothetical protein